MSPKLSFRCRERHFDRRRCAAQSDKRGVGQAAASVGGDSEPSESQAAVMELKYYIGRCRVSENADGVPRGFVRWALRYNTAFHVFTNLCTCVMVNVAHEQ